MKARTLTQYSMTHCALLVKKLSQFNDMLSRGHDNWGHGEAETGGKSLRAYPREVVMPEDDAA